MPWFHTPRDTTVERRLMVPFADSTLILAHQGGWDEFLMVAAPIIVFAFLLRAANRRLSDATTDVKELLEPDDDQVSERPKGLI